MKPKPKNKPKTDSRPDSKPEWSKAPEWAKWLAQNKSGSWYWFEHEPQSNQMPFMWVPREWETKGNTGQYLNSGITGRNNNNWKTTLEPRPQ